MVPYGVAFLDHLPDQVRACVQIIAHHEEGGRGAVIKTTYLRREKRLACGKKAVGMDERYLSSAERFLTGELAAALKKPRAEIREYIIEQIKG